MNLWDSIDKVLRQNYNIDALVFTLLHQLSPGQSEPFFTVLWSLWKHRNLKICQQQNKTSTQVIGWATHLQDEYWRVAQCLKSRSTTTTITNRQISISWDLVKWEKPTTRRYKCNINASFSSSLNIADLRMCIRDDYDDDDDGNFVLAKKQFG